VRTEYERDACACVYVCVCGREKREKREKDVKMQSEQCLSSA